MSLPSVIINSLLITVVLNFTSCGGSSSTSKLLPVPIPQPQNVKITAEQGSAILTWDSNSSYSYDIYLSTEQELNFETYSTFNNSEWIKNVSSPYTFQPSDYSKIYFFVVVSKSSTAESPQSNIVSVAPRYVLDGDKVQDLHTNLTWARCSEGQIWNNISNDCDGQPLRISNDEATLAASQKGDGWRIPTEDELISIVYCSNSTPYFFLSSAEEKCDNLDLVNPAIYSVVFPSTFTEPTSKYRTSTRWFPTGKNTVVFEMIAFAGGGRSQIRGGEPTGIFARLVKSTLP